MSVQPSLSNGVLPSEVLRHGAYLCLRPADAHAIADTWFESLARELGFQNEFDVSGGHPTDAFAFLRRVDAVPAQIRDDHLLAADAIVHIASPSLERVDRVCGQFSRTQAAATIAVMRGVARPSSYTGGAMQNFAYTGQVLQQPGHAMPHAFIVPMSKTAEWWAKSWMERHTYILPRYDENGRMLNEGHALAAAAGIPHLMRRTYTHATVPAPDGGYDFVNYFECADASVPTFHAVCDALRDVARNPEWRFVREGPTWHGRRVRTWAELFV